MSGLLGLYILARGLGAEKILDEAVERTTAGLYAGRVTIITYVVAAALLAIGGVSGVQELERRRTPTPSKSSRRWSPARFSGSPPPASPPASAA